MYIYICINVSNSHSLTNTLNQVLTYGGRVADVPARFAGWWRGTYASSILNFSWCRYLVWVQFAAAVSSACSPHIQSHVLLSQEGTLSKELKPWPPCVPLLPSLYLHARGHASMENVTAEDGPPRGRSDGTSTVMSEKEQQDPSTVSSELQRAMTLNVGDSHISSSSSFV